MSIDGYRAELATRWNWQQSRPGDKARLATRVLLATKLLLATRLLYQELLY